MDKLVVIDGNSILNRAFYGIMGNKMLQTADGTYTNAVYGFLSIMFKLLEDTKPQYLAVAFDMKHPTKRHEMYAAYKGTRKGMPDELASQLPIIKDVLNAMQITIIEKPGYEADDILGTLAVYAEQNQIETILLTGDRDAFQLATDMTTIRIPRTKGGKTETENFDKQKVIETYGVLPKQLIEVKGLMGDTSDNIPGVPGVGEKTALNLIKDFENVDNLYEQLEKGESGLKGKLKEKLEENKELAYLSRKLGTIDTNAPIEKDFKQLCVREWNQSEVLSIFKKLRFHRFIQRFGLEENVLEEKTKNADNLFKHVVLQEKSSIEQLYQKIKDKKKTYYYFQTIEDADENLIIKEKIVGIHLYIKEENTVYTIAFDEKFCQKIFEDFKIEKYGHKIKKDYILLKQRHIEPKQIIFDASIAAYLLNSIVGNYSLEELAKQYLEIDISALHTKNQNEIEQTSLFDDLNTAEEIQEKANETSAIYAFVIGNIVDKMLEELEKINALTLFQEIEMPTAQVLADMQYTGIYVDEEEIIEFGKTLKTHMDQLRVEIYQLVGEEFNINSTKQLGEILFEKLKLTPSKKTKSGYSTDVDALEKIREEHPVIEKILNYRQLMKLNSTYVEGMLPYIHPKTHRIHTFFHQTVTATGRISSTEPNLQNIPTRTPLGRELRKVFQAEEGKIFIDADYSQIELRVLAHMSNDEIMVKAFLEDADIHTICASQIFHIPVEEVTKDLRSKAKAVNFGIVYGISDFGLAEQIDMSRKEAKKYIEQYLATYHGIREFMQNVVESAKQTGYVETQFHRRRYIPELKSNQYMVRKFGDRAAMNTPIQGTAADIMKIAMVHVYQELQKRNLDAKIVLQIHDELLIETSKENQEEVKQILKTSMENAMQLKVPLKVELQVGKSWYEAK